MPVEAITWFHDEMLSPRWVTEGRPALFVFDAAWIDAERLSLKRIVFMYESALELPGIEIRKGHVVEVVTDFARRHRAERIETARSVDSRIKQQGEAMGVEWLEPTPMVEFSGPIDLKRFSRYWRKAEKQVLSPRVS